MKRLLRVNIEKWDNEHKGIDDLLNDGLEPEIIENEEEIEEFIKENIIKAEKVKNEKRKQKNLPELPSSFLEVDDSALEQNSQETKLEDSVGQIVFNDLYNARKLVQIYGNDLKFCVGEWYIWNGQRWKKDDDGEVMRRAKVVTEILWEEVQSNSLNLSEGQLKEYFNHARGSQSLKKMKAMIETAQSENGIPLHIDDFDADPWVLNCKNGTIDLKTGQLYNHRREDLITSMCPVDFNPKIDSPLVWDKFLIDVFSSDSKSVTETNELITYIQTAIGYSITGLTTEEKLFFAHGPAGTGKSTFINVISDVLGDYAKNTPFDTFLRKSNDNGGPRNDIARLVGARFVTSVEVNEGKSFDSALVKTITGADKVTARMLHKEFFDFTPKFKLWFGANDRPRISDTDTGMWRRIIEVPFLNRFEVNNKFKAMFQTDEVRSAILNWAMEGCLMWQLNGLKIPKSISETIDSYKEQMDKLKDFLSDCCEIEAEESVSQGVLYSRYVQWCKTSNERYILDKKAFWQRMMEKRFKEEKKNGIAMWKGLKLKKVEDVGQFAPVEFGWQDN